MPIRPPSQSVRTCRHRGCPIFRSRNGGSIGRRCRRPATAQCYRRPRFYEKVSPSVYIVLASEHAIELAPRTGYSLGSGVAVTDHILVTNCHVIVGKPQLSVTQAGVTSRARIVYADPGGDRCFLQVDGMALHPIQARSPGGRCQDR